MALSPTQVRWLRLAAMVALVAGLILGAHATGIWDDLSRDALRARVAAAGVWGFPLYVAAFSVALLIHFPGAGILFVAVGVALWDRATGAALAYAGGLAGVLISFAIVRLVGGKPLAGVENRVARRVLARLESHPLLTVFILRCIFYVGAPVNYALALSGMRVRDYVVGSALGLAGPTAVLAIFWDVLIGPA